MPGRTDGAILAHAFTRAIPVADLADALSATGVHPVDGQIARYKAAYFARFAEESTSRRRSINAADQARFKGVLPGVRECSTPWTCALRRVFLGLLTGNYEQGARKLE
jgi:hypothetical protein